MVDAAKTGAWDMAFLGIDPAREGEIGFTAAYLEIEATYLVPARLADRARWRTSTATGCAWRAGARELRAVPDATAEAGRARARARPPRGLRAPGRRGRRTRSPGLRQALLGLWPSGCPDRACSTAASWRCRRPVGCRGDATRASRSSAASSRRRRRPGWSRARSSGRARAASSVAPRAVRRMTPDFLYGTAWKEERTAALTELALRSGFRGIDTANQRRHYFEAGVGQRVSRPPTARRSSRAADLFLQTKFTYQAGRTTGLPYDPAADLSTQVAQSVASSLEHLGTGPRRQLRAARPRLRPRLDGPRQRGMGGDGAGARRRARAAPRREQRVAPAPPAAGGLRRASAGVRPEPLLRPRRLGPGGAGVLREAEDRLPGVLACSPRTWRRSATRCSRASPRHRADARPGGVRFARAVGMLPLTGTTDAAHMREDLGKPRPLARSGRGAGHRERRGRWRTRRALTLGE